MFTILLQDETMEYETGSVEQATHTHTHTHIHIVTGYEDHGSLTKSQTYTDTIQPDDPSKFNYYYLLILFTKSNTILPYLLYCFIDRCKEDNSDTNMALKENFQAKPYRISATCSTNVWWFAR